MFGMLKNLTQAVVAVAVLPVDIAADVVTLGRSLTSDDLDPNTFTGDRLRKIKDKVDEAIDE